MILDFIVLGIIVVFTLRGWWRGFIEGMASVLGFIIGYASAYLFCKEAAELIQSYVPRLPLPLRLALGGIAIFFLCSLSASILGYIIRHYRMSKLKGEALTEAIEKDRDRGSTLGLVQGLLFSSFLCIALGLIPEGNVVNKELGIKDSAFVAITRPASAKLLEKILSATSGSESSARVAARFIEDPKGAKEAASKVFEAPSIQKIAKDPSFLQKLSSADAEEIAKDPRFEAIKNDSELIEALHSLGFNKDELQFTPEQTKEALSKLQRGMEEVRQLMKNGELGQGGLSGLSGGQNIQGLLQDPSALQKIISRLSSLQGVEVQGREQK